MNEKRKFTDTETWKILRTALEIAVITAIVLALIWIYESFGFSEATADDYYETWYVLCDDYVNVRMTPNKKLEPIGRLEAGDAVYLDGKKRNGYAHCEDLGFEMCEGWVHKGYLVEDKPVKVGRKATVVSRGRLAARKYVNGRRTRWLKPMSTVFVYWWTEEWALTNCGYVQARYLELEGE